MSHAAHSRPVHDVLERGNVEPAVPGNTLEDAARRVIRSMPASKLATLTRIPERLLHRYAAPAADLAEHRPIPSRAIVPVTLATGRLEIVEYFARAVRCELHAIDDTPRTPASFLARVSAVTREHGQFQVAAAQAIADATLSASDRAAVATQLREAVEESLALLAALEREPVRKPGARAPR